MTVAFTFPGQGSQVVGMGKALADAEFEARAVFEAVDDALGEKLSEIIWEGPVETLTLTENAQPALMAVSLAAIRVLEARGIGIRDKAAYVAGHSLGEYSALAAAGALSVQDAARLLRARGRAMQAAVPVGAGAMAALLGMELDSVREVAAQAAEGEICAVANDNGGGQVVISGNKAAVERAIVIAQQKGAKRAILLPVSAPFHCALMAPAARVMEEALAAVEIRAPVVPVVANVLAAPVSEPAEIRRRLVEQVTGMVRWRESIAWLGAAGVRSSSSRSAPARCSAASPGASSTVPRRSPSVRRPMSTLPSPNSPEGGTGAMFDLTGKRALVTGASGGIGGAIARAAPQAGRQRRPVRHAARGARGARRRTGRAHAPSCPAISARPARSSSSSRRRNRRSAARSTSSSTMPASPATCSSRA